MDLSKVWTQFSVPIYEPNLAIARFCRPFYHEARSLITRWHFLFEPQLLVRFQVGEELPSAQS